MTENRKSSKKRKKSRIGYIILAIVVVIIAFVGVIAYINRSNIVALYKASRTTNEEIIIKQEENRRRTQEILDSLTNIEIKELSDEVREKLDKGEITREESLDIILGKETIESVMESKEEVVAENKNNESQTKPTVKPAEEKEQNKTGNKEKIIARIYLLRAEYLNKIDALIASGKASLKKIPQSEWNMSTKMSLVNQFASQGNALEASCDAKMEQLLGELKAELTRLGESTASIDEIRSAYQEQKQLKKEELFSKYYPD